MTPPGSHAGGSSDTPGQRRRGPRTSGGVVDYERLNNLALGRSPGTSTGERRRRLPLSRRHRWWVVAGLAVVAGAAAIWWYNTPNVSVSGLSDGDHVSGAHLANTPVLIDASGIEGQPAVTIDGKPAELVRVDGDGALRWRPPRLADGEHRLVIDASRRIAGNRATTIDFTIDSKAPTVELVTGPPTDIDRPMRWRGTTEPSAVVELTLGDETLSATAGTRGAFAFELDHPPVGTLRVSDAAGNEIEMAISTPIAHPGATAVHVTSTAWANPARKAMIIDMIERQQIDTVQLDLKDEGGMVGYDTNVPLAKEIGAVRGDYELKAALDELHDLGVQVVGRIVAFRDPMLATAAWDRGDHDRVIQTPSGDRFPAYDGGFVNYANADVREYNLDLAVEAANAGVDEIMWDYVRRPEGSPESMVIPGRGQELSGAHIVSFLAEGHERLRAVGTRQSAAVFGIAIDRGDSVAQDIPAMCQHLDAVNPMVYPSHWNSGELDVGDPVRQPYDIVKASVAQFVWVATKAGVPVIPWIQDFDAAIPYGAAEVQAQVTAAAEVGAKGVFVWNAESTYTPDGLPPLGQP